MKVKNISIIFAQIKSMEKYAIGVLSILYARMIPNSKFMRYFFYFMSATNFICGAVLLCSFLF